MTINLTKNNVETKVCSLIGRNGKVSYMGLDTKKPGALECHLVNDFTGNYNTAMLKYATFVAKSAIEQGVNVNCLTTDNNAIVYRYYAKLVNQGCTLEQIINTMTSSSYYQASEDDDSEMVTAKAESVEAVIDFVTALAEAEAQGLVVKFDKASEFNQLILDVPQGVEVHAGDVLKFVNGQTEDGIKVHGWSNFSRDYARVYVKVERDNNVYFLYRKNITSLSKIEQAQRDALAKQWLECPATKVEIDLDSAETFSFGF